MIFGDASVFAVEAEVVGTEGKWLFGHLRFWICGKVVGAFEDSADLASSARWARDFLRSSPIRSRADLDQSTTEEVIAELYDRFMYGVDALVGGWPNRDAFVFDDIGEASLRDRTSVIVVRRGDGSDRVIVRDLVSGSIQDCCVMAGTIDEALRNYVSWVEQHSIE